jgi:hypothetical protein
LVGYNLQSAVDSKHHLIIAHVVTNVGSDRRQLPMMAKQAKDILGTNKLKVVADKGYYKGEEIRECELSDIVPYVAKPRTPPNRTKTAGSIVSDSSTSRMTMSTNARPGNG